MHECYVCYEPCETPSECLCKGLYIHPSCLEMMKIYGKECCGVCKTPFPETEQEYEWNPTPCYWLILPTCCRPLKYDNTEEDRTFDIVRLCFFFVCCLVGFHLYTVRYYIEPADYIIIVFGIMITMFCCIGIGKNLRRQPHNLDLPLDHDIEVA